MRGWKSLVSWLFLLGGAFLLFEGTSSLYPVLISPNPIEADFRPATDSSPHIQTGSYVFRMTVPRLKTTVAVVEGTTDAALKKGPGHLEGSPWPGMPGNSVLAGHRDTHFRMLKDVRIGDEIWIDQAGHRSVFQVTATTVVKPEDMSVLRPTPEAILTLITCYPFYYLGPAPERFIIRAESVR